MKALLMTNEYPPHIYGGAGVHVEALARALAARIEVEVRCFGEQSDPGGAPAVSGHAVPAGLVEAAAAELRAPLGAFARSLSFVAAPIGADVVHCHTWYTHLAGVLAKLLYGLPLVVTTHSLEPLRPWKREQLGRGYDASSWVERTAIEMADAVIAVSAEAREDVLRHFGVDPARVVSVPNGIDPEVYRPVETSGELERLGVDPARPYVLFLGRLTRQKGVEHLLAAMAELRSRLDLVLCTGQADTERLRAETEARIRELERRGTRVHWIEAMVERAVAVELYSHAAVFCCPSIYEPFGLINLEAMACETPVVGTAVGGIKEVVAHEQTGLLVPWDPADPTALARDLARALERLAGDADLRRRLGEAGRRRAEREYSWASVAERTQAVYASVIAGRAPDAG